jgi:ribonucleoside-diphosphate reductase alpha chain
MDFQKLSPEQQAMALAAVRPLTMEQQESAPPRAVRHRLPAERASITHKFGIAGHEGYITVGLYKDGTPGELFIRMAKEGSTVSGLMDSFATAVSLALQHGVPIKLLCDKFSHTRFEPSGFTGNPEIPIAKSTMDYIFRWLELKFVTGRQYPLFKDMVLPGAQPPSTVHELAAISQSSVSETMPPQGGLGSQPGAQTPSVEGVAKNASSSSLVDRGIYHSADALKEFVDLGDAPSCHVCGSIMTRNGSCYRCMSCGSTSGCS